MMTSIPLLLSIVMMKLVRLQLFFSILQFHIQNIIIIYLESHYFSF